MKKGANASAKKAVQKEERRIRKLVRRAEIGDEQALSEVRKIVEVEPTIWTECGDLADQAERALVRVAAGENLIVRESICRKLESLKAELGGPGAPPLERLLVERVAACWLQMYYFDVIYAQNITKVTREKSEYYQRRQDRAHKRFLTAVKTLAQVRRLLVPAVQVNIGVQQVNKVEVSGDGQAMS